MKYLVTINIPYAVDARGVPYTDPLWAKDIERHAEHVDELLIAAPLATAPPPPAWVQVPRERPDHSRGRVTFIAVPSFRSLVPAWLGRAKIEQALAAAIASADVVQTNVAGWPLPLGWLAGPYARALGKPVVVNVESAPWRSARGRHRLHAWLYERLARREVQASDIAFFTHAGYRDELLDPDRPGPRAVHVVHATWIEDEFLVDETVLERRFAARSGNEPLRVLFAGRVVAAKGIEVLLRALETLTPQDRLAVTIAGDGDLVPALQRFASTRSAWVRVADPVPYGQAFLEVLDAHDLLVVPSLSDEQPRVVYDAFARGLPALASDTRGHRDCVEEGRTGWFFGRGDAAALADRLRELARGERGEVYARGRQARRYVATRTHRAMHALRRRLIHEALRRS